MKTENFPTRLERVPDLRRNRFLSAIDRFDILPPIAFAVFIFLIGVALETWAPQLGADRWQVLIWGYFISTVLLAHVTFSINSVAHKFGSRRFKTRDSSRNNFLLALLTFGEGWHNNHHKHPGSARQGMRWYEIDLTWYGLVLFQKLGLVWDLKSHDGVRGQKST